MPNETLKWIPKGYLGTAATIQDMRKLVDRAKLDKRIMFLASDIVSKQRERDQWGEAQAVFDWVQENIRYINDPDDTELLMYPMITVSRRAGDCDDQSMLYNALMSSIGYATRFKTIKADKSNKGQFSHVYSMIRLRTGRGWKWFSVDCTQRKPFGWEPPSNFGYQEWGYSGGNLTHRELPPSSLKGLGMLANSNVLRQAAMNLFNRKKKAPAKAKAATPSKPMMNAPKGPARNGWDNTYYGNFDNRPAGAYTFARTDHLFPEDNSEGELLAIPMPDIPVALPDARSSDDEKFRGRQILRPVVDNRPHYQRQILNRHKVKVVKEI